MKVLKFQNKKLGERLEELKIEEEKLKDQVDELKKQRESDLNIISVINRHWMQVFILLFYKQRATSLTDCNISPVCSVKVRPLYYYNRKSNNILKPSMMVKNLLHH